MPSGGLIAIFAHPDDEALVGGTLATYADRGMPVTVVCATRGEVGEIAPGTGATPETLGQFREQELRDAMAILGVDDVRFLDFRDSGMQGTTENDDPRSLNKTEAPRVIEPLVAIIRERRPDAIVTWDESGGYGHPDHVAIHFHATAAYHAAADGAKLRSAGAPWQARGLYYAVIPIEEFMAVMQEAAKRGVQSEAPGGTEEFEELPRVAPNCIIDVSAQYERKQRALEEHRTQLGSWDPFNALPDDLRFRLFGREYYYRAAPPVSDGNIINDLIAFDG